MRSKLVILLAFLLGGLAVLAGVQCARPVDQPPAAPPAPIRYSLHLYETPRPLRVHVLQIDRQAGLELWPLLAPDPDGSGPAEAALTPPLEIADRPGVLAAINACAFAKLPGTEDDGRGWYEGRPVTIMGQVTRSGQELSPPETGPRRLQLCVDGGGGARVIEPPDGVPAGGWSLEGWGEGGGALLLDGEIVASDEAVAGELHPRTALGLDVTGRMLTLVVVDGRQEGCSEGVTLPELAGLMQSLGCHAALNLDGGGSSILLLADPEGELRPMNRPSGGEPRPVPVMLVVRRQAAPPR
jgi:hypothetical protein